MKELRVTVGVRNNRLMEMREARGLTQKQAAVAAGIPIEGLCRLETCRLSPIQRVPPAECVVCGSDLAFPPLRGTCAGHASVEDLAAARDAYYREGRGAYRWTNHALRLAAMYETPIEDLFPSAVVLIADAGTSRREMRVDAQEIRLLLSQGEGVVRGLLESPGVSLDRKEREKALSGVLGSLSAKERLVLERLFGLEDGEEATLEEVADELSLSRERVRQIKAKALRKMCSKANRARLAEVAGA